MNVNDFRYQGTHLVLTNWDVYRLSGKDCVKFLDGQVSNNFADLDIGNSILTARLDIRGKVQSFFYLCKSKDFTYMIVPKVISESTIAGLDKYIIMDQVDIEGPLSDHGQHLNVYIGPYTRSFDQSDHDGVYDLTFYGEPAKILVSDRQADRENFWKTLDKVESKAMPLEVEEKWRFLSGWPKWGVDVDTSNFLNESFLNEIGASYSKGCFLGQETVAKINNNRGGAKFPVLVEFPVDYLQQLADHIDTDFFVENKNAGKILAVTGFNNCAIACVAMKREFRIAEKKWNFSFKDSAEFSQEGLVKYLPYFTDRDNKTKAEKLYQQAIRFFHANKNEEAINSFNQCLAIEPTYSDAYETLGVVLGHLENYEEAITMMDRLLEVDPDSVMAHTNKSLYFMKMGKIAEAEEEKAQATVKSFSRFGKEADEKKVREEKEAQQTQELERREGMFRQVLELDSADVVANFGMGDISFKKGAFGEAIDFFRKALDSDSKHSMAYLMLGKSLEQLGRKNEAKEIFRSGLDIASKKGEMMPANEMQSRLNSLSI